MSARDDLANALDKARCPGNSSQPYDANPPGHCAECCMGTYWNATDADDLAFLNSAEAVLAELDRLQRWKAEAMTVLSEWETVWEALGRPGPLGASKAANVLALVRGAAVSPCGGAPIAASADPHS